VGLFGRGGVGGVYVLSSEVPRGGDSGGPPVGEAKQAKPWSHPDRGISGIERKSLGIRSLSSEGTLVAGV